MPAWLEPNGPLNYHDVNELVALLRAASTTEFQGSIRRPAARPTTLHGWRDPAFAPAPGSTPVPNCWKDAFASSSAAPSAGASGAPPERRPERGTFGWPGRLARASGGATGAVLELTASGHRVRQGRRSRPRPGSPFQIEFTNDNAGIPHNVAIHKGSPTGEIVWQGEIFSGVDSRTYDVPALPAGTYGFSCMVHPNMTGTLTVK